MDPAYLHVLVNHFPIVLSLLGTAAAVASLVWRRRTIWLYAVATLTLAGVSVIPTFVTGRAAEKSMEDMWYVPKGAIHEHEEAGEFALWVLLAAGAVSAYAWRRATRSAIAGRAEAEVPSWLRRVIVLLAVASAGATSYAARRSDPIMHYSPRLQHPPALGIPAIPQPQPVPAGAAADPAG